MTQGVAHGHVVFPAGCELGPDVGDARVERDDAPVDQLQHERRHDRLADGVEVHERVVRPRTGPAFVRPSSAQVDDHLAVTDDAERRTDLAALDEVLAEGVANGDEIVVASAGDRRLECHHAVGVIS